MIFISVRPRLAPEGFLSAEYIVDYNHEIYSIGGYRSAQFSFISNEIDASRWARDGLAAKVVAKNEFGEKVWEGFVNSITITSGRSTMEIGPVLDISNIVAVTYSTPSYEGLNISYQKKTAYKENSLSVERYGKMTKMVSGGERSDEDALAYRDKFLLDSSYPMVIDTSVEQNENIQTTISVDCAGYTRLLERTVYNYTLDKNKQSLVNKINTVLDRVFFEGGRSINKNATGMVDGWEDGDRDAWSVITSGIESSGMETETRKIVAGVYDGKFVLDFADIETDMYTMDSVSGKIYRGGNKVRNSTLRPGMFMKSRNVSGNSAYYVESTSYSLTGDTVSTNKVKRSVQSVFKKVYGTF